MLPIIILLIPQLNQQISRNIFEDLLVFFGEVFLPFTSFAGAEGRGLFRVNGGFEGIKNQLSGSRKRDAAEEVIHDGGESRLAVVDQVFEVNGQNFGAVKPAEIRFEAVCDI